LASEGGHQAWSSVKRSPVPEGSPTTIYRPRFLGLSNSSRDVSGDRHSARSSTFGCFSFSCCQNGFFLVWNPRLKHDSQLWTTASIGRSPHIGRSQKDPTSLDNLARLRLSVAADAPAGDLRRAPTWNHPAFLSGEFIRSSAATWQAVGLRVITAD